MRGSWHPRLWLPLAAAGSLTLTPVADTAERELWAGTVTYRKKIATKCKSAVRGKDCTASCSIDEVLPDMEVVLGVVIPPHRWEDLSHPVKLRYTWKQDNKGSWVRNSETCCGRKNVKSPKACTRADLPVRKKRPGNSGECALGSEMKAAGSSGWRLRFDPDRTGETFTVEGNGNIQRERVQQWNLSGKLTDACSGASSDSDEAPLLGVVGAPEPVRVHFLASGSFTEPQISLLPPTPSADRAGRGFDCQSYAHSCNSCQCPGSATTMEEAVVVDLKRATCSDRGEGYVESAVGDCYMQAKDSEHGCQVPSLLTCVRAYPADAREKCNRLHCQTDATEAQKAVLASCIDGTLETWLQVNERCRKGR